MKINIFAKLLLLGCLSSMLSAIVVSKDGIAKDSTTGLEWQDEAYTETKKLIMENLGLGSIQSSIVKI